MSKKVLLIIDALNDFFDPKGVLYCGESARKIIPVIRSLMDRFHEDGNPIVFLRDAHAPDDKEFELFPPHAVKGEWGAEIIPELSPPEGSVLIEKTRFSGLFGNRLPELLAALKPDEVWVTGVCTSICVMDTVGDLRNHDYRVAVPVDAVADFDEEFHDFSLRRMQRLYGARLLKAGG